MSKCSGAYVQWSVCYEICLSLHVGLCHLLVQAAEWIAPRLSPSSNTLQLVYQQPFCHTQPQVHCAFNGHNSNF